MPDASPTFAYLLERRAADDRPGLRFEGSSWTWREVIGQSRQRGALAAAACPSGRPPHIGVMLDNTPEFLWWIFGAALSRTTVVGVNTTRRGDELAADVRHADCSVLVTDREHLPLLDGLDIGVDDDRVLVVDDPSYLDQLNSAPDATAQSKPEDRLLLLFTSGSTGTPKAVICTTGRLARIAATSAPMFGLTADDVCYQAMPMFHGNALMADIAPATEVGATIVLRRRFSASGFGPDVRREGATFFTYVGRTLAYVLATPTDPHDGDNRLRLGFGTEATTQDREQFTARFGCPLLETYGSSEGVVSMSVTPETPTASIGLPTPVPGSDVAIVDPETMTECAPATFDPAGALLNPDAAIGEIVNRGGPVGFEGYYRDDAATAERVRDGWYFTGDLGYRDAAGFFYFAGRTADRLRVDSENFAAAPIERILARHPAVAVAAVYPVPDARTGDQVMAALELVANRHLDPADLDDFLATQADLGTKWAPRFVRVVDALPVTGSNKVAKASLRRDRWNAASVWWRPQPTDGYRAMTDTDRDALRRQFTGAGREHILSTGL